MLQNASWLCFLTLCALVGSNGAVAMEHRHRYEYSKFLNFRVDPGALVYRAYEGDVTFAPLSFLSIGPAVSYYDGKVSLGDGAFGSPGAISRSAGVRANIYFAGNAMSSGLILGLAAYESHVSLGAQYKAYVLPGLVLRQGKVTSSYIGHTYRAVVAYQFFTMLGLNFTLGGGLTKYEFPGKLEFRDSAGRRYWTGMTHGNLGSTYQAHVEAAVGIALF